MFKGFVKYTLWITAVVWIPFIILIGIINFSFNHWPDNTWNITAISAAFIFIIDFIIIKKYWK